jgi:hypothetical protein
MDAARQSELTLTSDWLRSKVEDKLLISGVRAYCNGLGTSFNINLKVKWQFRLLFNQKKTLFRHLQGRTLYLIFQNLPEVERIRDLLRNRRIFESLRIKSVVNKIIQRKWCTSHKGSFLCRPYDAKITPSAQIMNPIWGSSQPPRIPLKKLY